MVRELTEPKFLAETLGLLQCVPLPQSLQNRYGQKVIINLSWTGGAVDKSDDERSDLPPLEAQTDTGLPPLKEHTKPLRECKHQKPASGGKAPGVLEGKKAGEPTLTHIVPEDLRNTARLLKLFEEAQDRGLIGGSESERLTFVATAERARVRGTTNPEGLFAELVRKHLWHFITQDDEDRAKTRLMEYLYGGRGEETFRVIEGRSEALSKDALFVADISARLRRQGFVGDVFSAVSLHLPDWTRKRWDRACGELEEAKKNRAGNAMSRAADFSLLSSLQVR